MNDERNRSANQPFQADNDGTGDTQEPRPKPDGYRTILPPEGEDAKEGSRKGEAQKDRP